MVVADDENDLQSVSYKLGTASVFIEAKSEQPYSLRIPNNSTSELVGKYPITILLLDAYKNNNTYTFTLIIDCPKGLVISAANTCIAPF